MDLKSFLPGSFLVLNFSFVIFYFFSYKGQEEDSMAFCENLLGRRGRYQRESWEEEGKATREGGVLA